jgi:hypothetical protein
MFRQAVRMTGLGEQLFDDLMRLKPEELTANGWAVKAGVSRTIWADIRRHGNPSRRTLEKLLAAAGSNLAEFEALRIGTSSSENHGQTAALVGETARTWRHAPLPPLPVVETRQGGDWVAGGDRLESITLVRDRAIDRQARPASLADDSQAYGLTIIGDSMWPRFRPGKRVAASPAAPVRIGDDVLVLLAADAKAGQQALLKELVRRTGSLLELRQFNPDLTFTVPADAVQAVHKIVGELI